jgi:hypothetical protein
MSCLLRELTASQLVAIATRSDTGSHNRLDLIQSLVPPHYVCNGYISWWSVLLVEETRVPGENHRSVASRQVVMQLVHATGKTWYKVLYQHTMYVISLSNISIKTNFKQITRVKVKFIQYSEGDYISCMTSRYFVVHSTMPCYCVFCHFQQYFSFI